MRAALSGALFVGLALSVPALANDGATYPTPMPTLSEGLCVPLTTSPIFSAATPALQIG